MIEINLLGLIFIFFMILLEIFVVVFKPKRITLSSPDDYGQITSQRPTEG